MILFNMIDCLTKVLNSQFTTIVTKPAYAYLTQAYPATATAIANRLALGL